MDFSSCDDDFLLCRLVVDPVLVKVVTWDSLRAQVKENEVQKNDQFLVVT